VLWLRSALVNARKRVADEAKITGFSTVMQLGQHPHSEGDTATARVSPFLALSKSDLDRIRESLRAQGFRGRRKRGRIFNRGKGHGIKCGVVTRIADTRISKITASINSERHGGRAGGSNSPGLAGK
jgi:hypothetical protein